MKCQYCDHFYKAQDRRLQKQNDKVIYSERYCRLNQAYVTGDNKICDDFIITKSFWCNKEENWLDIIVCIHRQNKGYCKCRQGKEVIKTARRRPDSTNNLSKKEPIKSKLIKRESPKIINKLIKREEPKNKLKRRL